MQHESRHVHPDDPWLWLEEVDSGRARAWVDERNSAT